MLIKKMQDHAIDLKEEFVLRKEKFHLLFREERKKVRKFIGEQMRKEYIQLSKLSQTALIFFVEKKDKKKRIV